MTSPRIHLWLATSAVAIASTLYVLLACGGSPPPQEAPAPVACAKDTDCKGDRICERGDCISPR